MATVTLKPALPPPSPTFLLELNAEEYEAVAACLDSVSAAFARRHGFNYHAVVNVSSALNEG